MVVRRHARIGSALIGTLALVAVTLIGTTPVATAAPTAAKDIKDRVAALPHVTSVTEAAAPAGYRFFTITFEQPVNHDRPDGPTFQQRLTLLHKDVARPMVMYTSGYNVSQSPSRSEPTQIVDGNQLSMEYRFFDPSRPAKPNWPKQLTIKQAATDQHEIIRSFKKLYQRSWITTGGSKGGMTATYHRRFFPNDVDGTVPYVAPNDVVDAKDAYNGFLGRVGTSQTCRDAITEVQRRVLGRDRAWFLDRALTDAADQDLTWNIVGNPEMAWESAVVDAYFGFWQYQPASACDAVPTTEASKEDVYAWFEDVSPMTGYTDQSVGGYTPYYYQAAYQLGAPHPYENRIRDLLRFPGADVASTFVPAALKPITHDATAMPDIDRWVRTKSTEMLYVYGSNDPWSAEPFACGAGARDRDCLRFYVAGGNHGSSISQLARPDQQKATTTLLRWAGLGASDTAVRQIERSGEPDRQPQLDRSEVRRMGPR